MAGQQADEADEDFLDALGRLAMPDGALLGVLQVEQEDGIEHPQDLALVDVVGVQVADDFAHLREQVPGGIRSERLLRLVQLHDGHVGQVHEVVDGRFSSLFLLIAPIIQKLFVPFLYKLETNCPAKVTKSVDWLLVST